MYIERYTNGDIRVTFTDAESYWAFLEVADFKTKPWAIRIFYKNNFFLAENFPTREEYYRKEYGI